jgi:hypothetical protein
MPNQKFIKKRVINKNFLKKNIIKLKGVFSKKKKNISDDPLKQLERRFVRMSPEYDIEPGEGRRDQISGAPTNQKSVECPQKNRYKYVNKVNGDWHYKYNTNPKFSNNMSKLKNDNDKYFYSRVNKQYCSNQKMLEDKIEEIRYREEKETRKKLRNVNPNSLYNGYYIGKKKCKGEDDGDCKDGAGEGRGHGVGGVVDAFVEHLLIKNEPNQFDVVDPKRSTCHKCNYKIKIPNINTKYKEISKNKCNCCSCKNKELKPVKPGRVFLET